MPPDDVWLEGENVCVSLEGWQSESRGMAYRLGWNGPYPGRCDISVMSKALRDHEQSLDSCPFFGLISERRDSEGWVIAELHPFSPLRRAGVRERDVVETVQHENRNGPPQSRADAMVAATPGDRLVIRMRRRREPLSLRLLSFREVLQGAAEGEG